MKVTKKSSPSGNNSVLISIHPIYAKKIISGEKRVEFRRSWASNPVKQVVFYSTAPVQRIVAIAQIMKVHVGTKTKLWGLAQELGGGISRRKLFEYLEGKNTGVAIELGDINIIAKPTTPIDLFGDGFRPPQSFRYFTDDELLTIITHAEEAS